jgi:hypothetical protein
MRATYPPIAFSSIFITLTIFGEAYKLCSTKCLKGYSHFRIKSESGKARGINPWQLKKQYIIQHLI